MKPKHDGTIRSLKGWMKNSMKKREKKKMNSATALGLKLYLFTGWWPWQMESSIRL